MALTFTDIAHAEDNASPSSLALPSTVDLVQGRLYLLFIEDSTTIDVTGVANNVDAQTWDSVSEQTYNSNTRMSVFRCEADANVTNTTITITFASATTGASAILIEVTGHVTGNNGADAITQVTALGGASGTTRQATLGSALANADSRHVSYFCYQLNAAASYGGDTVAPTTGAGGSGNEFHNNPSRGILIGIDDDTVADAAWSSTNSGVIHFEVLAAATLTHYSLDCQPGSFAVTGAPAATVRDVPINAAPGSFAVTGAAAAVLADRIAKADPGSFSIDGAAAALVRDLDIDAQPAAYVLTGADATLQRGYELNAEPGVFEIVGDVEGGGAPVATDLGEGTGTTVTLDAPADPGRVFIAVHSYDSAEGTFLISVTDDGPGLDWMVDVDVENVSNHYLAIASAYAPDGLADDVSISLTYDVSHPPEFGPEWTVTGISGLGETPGPSFPTADNFDKDWEMDIDLDGPGAIFAAAWTFTFDTLSHDPDADCEEMHDKADGPNMLADVVRIEEEAGTYSVGGVFTGTTGLVISAAVAYEAEGGAAQETTLIADRIIDAQPGSYAVTGAAAGVLADRHINAAPGSFTLTGVEAALSRGFNLDAEPGAYDIAGEDAGLLADRVINAEPGSYEVTGLAALFDIAMAASPGSYIITGIDAELEVGSSGLTHYTLNAEPGSFAISGASTALLADRLINAEPGSIGITGSPAALLAARILSASAGSYAVTGAAASLLVARQLAAMPGTFTITGADVEFVLEQAPSLQLPATGDIVIVQPSGRVVSLVATPEIVKVLAEGEINEIDTDGEIVVIDAEGAVWRL